MTDVRKLPVMRREDAEVVAGDELAIAGRIGVPFEQWGGRCQKSAWLCSVPACSAGAALPGAPAST
jgi:hypothetical protein